MISKGCLAMTMTAVAFTSAAYAQPANDNCANAIPVANHSTTPFDLTGATRDGLLSCNNHATARDIWYTYTASGAETVTIDLCGSSPDSVRSITAFAGGCGSTELACSRDFFCDVGQPQVVFNVPAAGTYLIAIANRFNPAGFTGVMNINAVPYVPPPPPPGDTCADPIIIPGPGSYGFDSTLANTDGPPGPCNTGGQQDAHDIYFSYTPTADAWVRFDTLQDPLNPGNTSEFDTTLQVYNACGGTLLACNDDRDHGTVGSLTCPLHVSANTPYIIRVASWGVSGPGREGLLRLSNVAGPIVWTLPANAIPEPGPDCDDDVYTDVNYGCNGRIDPQQFRATNIQLCETRKGHIYGRTTPYSDGAPNNDLDAYHFTLATPQAIHVTGQSLIRASVILLSLPCDTGTLYSGFDGMYLNPECGAAEFSIDFGLLPAGEYLLNIGLPLGYVPPPCGTNTEYWFHITGSNPCSSPCPADLDNDGAFPGGTPDGGVDINDLLYFLAGFEAGSASVDIDNDGDPAVGTPDGGVDINDLLFFLARFELGC